MKWETFCTFSVTNSCLDSFLRLGGWLLASLWSSWHNNVCHQHHRDHNQWISGSRHNVPYFRPTYLLANLNKNFTNAIITLWLPVLCVGFVIIIYIPSKCLLKQLTLLTDTTLSGNIFHSLTTLFTKNCYLSSYLHSLGTDLYLFPLVSCDISNIYW